MLIYKCTKKHTFASTLKLAANIQKGSKSKKCAVLKRQSCISGQTGACAMLTRCGALVWCDAMMKRWGYSTEKQKDSRGDDVCETCGIEQITHCFIHTTILLYSPQSTRQKWFVYEFVRREAECGSRCCDSALRMICSRWAWSVLLSSSHSGVDMPPSSVHTSTSRKEGRE